MAHTTLKFFCFFPNHCFVSVWVPSSPPYITEDLETSVFPTNRHWSSINVPTTFPSCSLSARYRCSSKTMVALVFYAVILVLMWQITPARQDFHQTLKLPEIYWILGITSWAIPKCTPRNLSPNEAKKVETRAESVTTATPVLSFVKVCLLNALPPHRRLFVAQCDI